jgi:hypothetical protein
LKKQWTEEKMKLEEMVKLIMQNPRILNNGMFDPIRELVTDAVVHPAKYNLGILAVSIPNNVDTWCYSKTPVSSSWRNPDEQTRQQ